MEELTSELLSEVLDRMVTSIKTDKYEILNMVSGLANGNDIAYYCGIWKLINKYEFMHLCKTFIAINYYMEINIYHNGCYLYLFKYKDGKDSFEYKSIMNSVGNKDEEEAIIKATKWVIENKDK